MAPTAAELLKFDGFHAPDGTPMTEALLPADQRKTPKLVVTMVWDAGGMNVLQAHPTAWPYLKSLIPKGTFFTDATVGSSPTSTAQIHATIGTGSFPDHHGIVGHNMLVAGKIIGPWNQGPSFLVEPTLADIYDRAMDNEPVVGLVGTVDIHFGMLGHGGFFTGGDRDIALTRSVVGGTTLTDEGFEWNLPEHDAAYYRLPTYANKVPGFEQDVAAVDQADGKKDGKWRDNDIDELLQGFDTPARTPYQQRVVEEVMTREDFGQDDTPDLLYLNFKEIDFVSHVWSMNSPEMEDAVVAQDAALKEFVTFLDKEVGKGEWVLGLTADHAVDAGPVRDRRLPDLLRPHAGHDQREVRHRRRRPADRGADAADAGLPRPERTEAERLHRRRRGPVHDDVHPGADGRRRRRPESGSGERHRDAGGVPIGVDARPPLFARSARVGCARSRHEKGTPTDDRHRHRDRG